MSVVRFTLCVFACFIFMSASVSVAQEDSDSGPLTDEFVTQVLKQTRPRVKDLKISDTEFVGLETAEELADPLLTIKQARVVLGRGIISGMAEWCKLDWQSKSFIPFMKHQRTLGYSSKQVAYIGMLHGYGMSISTKATENKECDTDNRKRVLSYFGE